MYFTYKVGKILMLILFIWTSVVRFSIALSFGSIVSDG